ncbi:protein MAINTENANCE OF MERISTEMS-like [Vicia villosa]|uniref:protein MAINTENANCE OF MERISTEMS-like n=1 Tax=Vicia villosa TaxID=3911 RepID=UPI00273AD578|nr:protein MAINTENANCE OF MERISTEMS-like [Vicia villosa]
MLCIVSQVTDGAAVVLDPPSTSTSDTPVSAGPILSPASVGPIRSPASARHIPSPVPAGLSTSTTPSRRPQDDPEGASYLLPPSHRLRQGNSFFAGPPPEVHEDDLVRGPVPVPEPVWYPGGPVDASLLIGYADHAARCIWDGDSRDSQRFYNHGRKIRDLAQPDQPWFQEVLAASGLRDLYMLGYYTIHNGMPAAFVERWHLETSSFHLLHGEITITLNDVACLLHLPIRGTLFRHGRMTKAEAQEMLIAKLGADPDDALEEVERTRGVHVRFSFLQRQYDLELTAAHQAEGDDLEQATHRERALRCYFLYLIDTQLFVDTSSTYTDVVYHTYLSDISCIHEYNWGAAAWILQHFPDIIGWKEVSTYTEVMLRAKCFFPRRGNPHSDPYRRGLDCMATEDIRYGCYAAPRETVPFGEIALYSRWLAASSTIVVRYLSDQVMRQFGYEQTIPRDPSVLAPIAMTRMQLEEVFADWEHHMVPEEARATP